MAKKYYAHSLDGRSPSEWQPLEEHLLLTVRIEVIWRGYGMI